MNSLKERLKRKIDMIDEQYLVLLYKIISQFPRKTNDAKSYTSSQELAELAQQTNFEQPTLIREPKAVYGSARGLVEIGPDFDQPLEEFEG